MSALHSIFYEEVGRESGRCALFLHGGPGVGILPGYRRFFDPAHYRTILVDQRGAGRSTPFAELEENNTWALVEDLEKLRKHLRVSDWIVMGGSWGSLLALCYAIRYPDRVSGMILRGIFLGRPAEMSWVYGGTGTAQIFPEHWARFRSLVPESKEADTAKAYYKLLTGEDQEAALTAAKYWAEWSASTMTLLPDPAAVAEIASDKTVLPVSRIECHFENNQFFLPSPNFVIDNAAVIQDIPTEIVHGRYDAICAVKGAWDLHQALPASKLTIVPDGGHSPMEPPMAEALIRAAESMKSIR
ncbi:MAG: prolyl aminopeptidase [Alphaproteobacteria bacterium]|nr:prolyl aminopeptidase [Alphaproteobacteria bacterium]